MTKVRNPFAVPENQPAAKLTVKTGVKAGRIKPPVIIEIAV